MLLYQLLSGTLPFWEEGESQSPFTVMTAILGGEVSFDGPAWQAISPHGAGSLGLSNHLPVMSSAQCPAAKKCVCHGQLRGLMLLFLPI